MQQRQGIIIFASLAVLGSIAGLTIAASKQHSSIAELETRVRALTAKQESYVIVPAGSTTRIEIKGAGGGGSDSPVLARASRNTWPVLGMDKTIALAEALKSAKLKKVAVFCPEIECDAIAHDIDDAMQIIDVPSDLDHTRIGQNQQPGVTVIASTTEAAQPVAKAFASIGIPASVDTEERPEGDIIIAIGRKPR